MPSGINFGVSHRACCTWHSSSLPSPHSPGTCFVPTSGCPLSACLRAIAGTRVVLTSIRPGQHRDMLSGRRPYFPCSPLPCFSRGPGPRQPEHFTTRVEIHFGRFRILRFDHHGPRPVSSSVEACFWEQVHQSRWLAGSLYLRTRPHHGPIALACCTWTHTVATSPGSHCAPV